MGVKNLWTILTPYCERKPLFELQGKTLAIDLSCWIVDTQNATDHVMQQKMYLRNLYFRTTSLLLQNIRPVFVLEGKAPEIKQKTIDKRNEAQQFKRTGTIADRKTAAKSGRTRFNNVLKECQEMLSYMGLECVQGYGEAEAMCAYLNADGIVDGCVSQDNDCFLYGARVVYRNFNLSGGSASAGSIDVYEMEKTETDLSLDRNKMIALALLCGCDYDDGLNGAGREAAMKLFSYVKDQDILDRLRSWKGDKKFDRIEAQLNNSKLCTSCGHGGNVRSHNKSGCEDCFSIKGCKDDYKEERKLIQNEIMLRKKALLHHNFPNQEIIDEYLIRKGPVPSSLDLKWQQPNLVKFIFFMEKKVGWDLDYSFEKFLPLITRWQIISLPEITLSKSISFNKYAIDLPIKRIFFPDRIKKIRNIKSVASYEIIWKDCEGFLDGLVDLSAANHSDDGEICEELNSGGKNNVVGILATIEPQNLISKCYPDLVEKYEEFRTAGKKKKKNNSKGKTATGKPEKRFDKDSDSNAEKMKKPALKRERKKLVHVLNTKKIDDFMLKNDALSLEDSFGKLEITPKRLKQVPQIERIKKCEVTSKLNNTLDKMLESLTPDDFLNEDEETFDMSGIIEEICKNKNGQDLCSLDDIEKGNDENIRKESIPSSGIQNSSDFFINQNDSGMNNEDINDFNDSDEFAGIDKYVPLSQRVNFLQ